MIRDRRPGAMLLAACLALGIGSVVLDRVGRVKAAGVHGAALRSRSDVAEAAAEPLGARQRRSACRSMRRITSGSFIAPARSKPKETYADARTRRRRECCAPAPPVLEFDEAGNLVGHWGGPGAGLRLAGFEPRHHGRLQRQRLDRRQRPRRRSGGGWKGGRSRAGRAPGRARSFNDNMVLKFTQDGKFLMQIGKPDQSKGSNDIENLKAAGEDVRRPEDQRTVRRRRLRQPARDRLRRRHRQVQAPLGRLRQQAGRHATLGRYNPSARPRSSSAIRCTAPSSRNDGLVYVCDRVNDRIQVFKPDGKFVKEVFIAKNTLGDGSVWDIAFSKDPQQKYIYLADGANEKVLRHSARHAGDPDQLRRRRPPARRVLRACTASPPIRRATSTRRKPTAASACRSSSTRDWRR